MKETESLETQLRSWRPRRPSAGLERRIFCGPARFVSRTAWLVGSLAPAVACALITLSIFSRENFNGSLPQVSMIASLSQPPGSAETELTGVRKGENNWASVTFDWTNRSGFTSSIAPFVHESLH
jgi:hypothetical protein